MNKSTLLREGEFVGPDEAWKTLGAAIVFQAASDFEAIMLKLRHPDKVTKDDLTELHSTERWLRSGYPLFYADVDGRMILDRLKKIFNYKEVMSKWQL